MTSYRFRQRATIEVEIYPGFGFSDNTKIRSRDNFPTPFTEFSIFLISDPGG